MNKEIKQNILIVVRGGVVQDVYSNLKNIKIDLLDFDNEVFQNDEEADKEFENRKKDLYNIKF